MLMSHPFLVVVSNLDVVGVAIDKSEAEAPLVVDRDRVLSFPVAPKCVKSITWRDLQVLEAGSQVHVFELPNGSLGDIRRNRFDLPVAYNVCVCLSANVLITH